MKASKLFGIAFDGTTIYLPGTKYTPYILQTILGEKYSIKIIESNAIHELYDSINLIKEYITMCHRKNYVPLFIGGEHTITYFILHSINELFGGDICTIIFDAHVDMHDTLYGHRISHGTFVRRLLEEKFVRKVVIIGVRVINSDEENFITRLKLNDNSVLEIIDNKGASVASIIYDKLGNLKSCDYLHISVDIDVFDPKIAPGVCNPVPLGIELPNFKRIIKALFTLKLKTQDKTLPISVDIVEANPLIDKGLRTVFLVKDIIELIGESLE